MIIIILQKIYLVEHFKHLCLYMVRRAVMLHTAITVLSYYIVGLKIISAYKIPTNTFVLGTEFFLKRSPQTRFLSNDDDVNNERIHDVLMDQGVDLTEILQLQREILLEKNSTSEQKNRKRAYPKLLKTPSVDDITFPFLDEIYRVAGETDLENEKIQEVKKIITNRHQDDEDSANVPSVIKHVTVTGLRSSALRKEDRPVSVRSHDSTINIMKLPSHPKNHPADTHLSEAKKGPTTADHRAKTGYVDLNGVTLKSMVQYLVEILGYEKMFMDTNLRCFTVKPTLTSSLKALRKPDMDWARMRVESLYIQTKKSERSLKS